MTFTCFILQSTIFEDRRFFLASISQTLIFIKAHGQQLHGNHKQTLNMAA
jgi:hypothetical protein